MPKQRNANSEMRRAEAFWERADFSLKRARCALAMERCLHQSLALERNGRRYRLITEKIDALADFRIVEEDNFYCAVESARAAEMMARIHYEEGS